MLAKQWNMFFLVFVFHGSSDNIQNPTINLHIIVEYGRSYSTVRKVRHDVVMSLLSLGTRC